MKSWATLLRREWWEHRARFGWTPLAIGVFIVLFVLWVLTVGSGGDVTIDYRTSGDASAFPGLPLDALPGLFDYSSWPLERASERLDILLYAISRPLVYAHYLIAVLVLGGALNDDRRDRSVLFWQSLPVSDLATVTSKLVLAVWIAPLVTVGVLVTSWCAVLLLLGAFASGGTGPAAPLAMAGVPSLAFAFLTGYAVQGLWTLPLYAIVLLASAAVPRAPLLWASLAPLVPVVFERMFFGSNRLWTWLLDHGRLHALPRPEALSGNGVTPVGFSEQLALLTSIDLWIGVVVAVALLAVTRWLRARATDL